MSTITVVPESDSLVFSPERIQEFQKKVFSFYQKNKRDLPWRKTTDPYKILLSELMLQQTQVNRVILYYEKWIARWPAIDALASASLAEVLQAWMGLGYNTRAINLHKAARKIVTEFDNDVIEAMKQYKEIPGVGRYTSQAVQIFSTNTDLVTVDTNIRRIFIKEFHLPEKVSDKELWGLAERCLPKGRSREWHNALMDYGALHLTATKTGIKPKTQQSRFEGSDRQLRARIIRILLQNDESLVNISRILNVDISWLQRILEKLISEEIISKKNNRYYLKE
ncbi:MAG: Fe-S cluster assembly protein HesB [Thermoplasmata archaeon]|nr:Fe-S cluster assembly protein HesB [Thermoplasmata archaeon]MBE3137365.1 Fe-S cluster assembly protein HesB [Thermoplasmata archaeon]MBE3141126.1 Fe-S cluster assembly protein HesB [Thermoplasmata archaeon]